MFSPLRPPYRAAKTGTVVPLLACVSVSVCVYAYVYVCVSECV